MLVAQKIIFWLTFPIAIAFSALLVFGAIYSPFYVYAVCRDRLKLIHGVSGFIAASVALVWACIVVSRLLPKILKILSKANSWFFEITTGISLIVIVVVLLIPWSPFFIERIFFPFKFSQKQSIWFSRLRIYIVCCIIGMVLSTLGGDDHCSYDSLPGGRMVPTNPMCW